MKRKIAAIICGVLLALFCFPSLVLGDDVEEILNYHSDITVHQDGSMTVEETITVNSLGQQILHGIYREFPTTYKDRLDNVHRVGFRVTRIMADGVPEDYHMAAADNGQRIYIGKSDVYLAPGVHTYLITYETDRQLGFFKDHDELYWNVTGNGWVFPIKQASATVHLPPAVQAQDIRVSGYTGPFGSQDQYYSSSFDPGQNVTFQATRPLNAFEGLTIVVGWPKGIVTEPDIWTRIMYFLQDNKAYILFLLGLLGVFLYFVYAWNKVGRDPEKGTIVPLFTPPGDMSPAAMRYTEKMGFDTKTLTCAVIDMAVKGGLNISEDNGRDYALFRKPIDPSVLSAEEAAIYNVLPSNGLFSLSNTNHSEVQQAISACKNVLSDNCQGNLFVTNSGYFIGGMALSLIVCFSIFTTGKIVPLILAGIMFFILNLVFYRLLKAPTIAGRKVMDGIEGFKMFLTIAEKDRLNMMYPGGQTPQLFEKYLPYALALDVEQAWADQFADVLTRASADGTTYVPLWYAGSAWSPYHPAHFASSLGNSFSNAISSAATPPGSSSGFSGGGGGGFSGGGGGGGGGGGW